MKNYLIYQKSEILITQIFCICIILLYPMQLSASVAHSKDKNTSTLSPTIQLYLESFSLHFKKLQQTLKTKIDSPYESAQLRQNKIEPILSTVINAKKKGPRQKAMDNLRTEIDKLSTAQLNVLLDPKENYMIRVAACDIAKIRKDPSLGPDLISILEYDDGHPIARIRAIEALSTLNYEPAIPALKKALGDRNWQIRIPAYKGLMNFGKDVGFKALVDVLENGSQSMQDGAIWGISHCKDIPNKTSYLIPFLKHKSIFLRTRTIYALEEIFDDAAITNLVLLLNDELVELRNLSTSVLVKKGYAKKFVQNHNTPPYATAILIDKTEEENEKETFTFVILEDRAFITLYNYFGIKELNNFANENIIQMNSFSQTSLSI